MRRLSLGLRPAVYDWLAAEAARQDMTISTLIRVIIAAHIRQLTPREDPTNG